ncbi:MAG: GNAT family N-acetyltransferase [Succinimonas sp.]|nr:GNAT family N-acetyltransferase [Succinimonas sp.]
MSAKAPLNQVTLNPLDLRDQEHFITANQTAFNYGALEEFGLRDDHFEEDGNVISRDTIREAISAGTAFRIIADGKPAGGVVIRTAGNRGYLDLLFVTPELHSRGIGAAAWQAVERMHPEITVWETVTPYFEKRNIHFYVNRLGFRIVEFFNSHHPDPHEPEAEGSGDSRSGHSGPPDEMFRFEKEIKLPSR